MNGEDPSEGFQGSLKPECAQTIPPLISSNETSENPASRIIAAKACCGGNLRMLSTRYWYESRSPVIFSPSAWMYAMCKRTKCMYCAVSQSVRILLSSGNSTQQQHLLLNTKTTTTGGTQQQRQSLFFSTTQGVRTGITLSE